jgi:hypothetical protein
VSLRGKPEKIGEFSTSFDLKNVRPFLERLRPIIASGFGGPQIDEVSKLASTLKHDQEQELKFTIQHRGIKTTLRIVVFMDDINSPDVFFFAPESLTARIQEEFEKFAEELGI